MQLNQKSRLQRPRSAMAKLETPRSRVNEFIEKQAPTRNKKDRNVFSLTNIYEGGDDHSEESEEETKSEEELPELFKKMIQFSPTPPKQPRKPQRFRQRKVKVEEQVGAEALASEDDHKSKLRQPLPFVPKRKLTKNGTFVQTTTMSYRYKTTRINFHSVSAHRCRSSTGLGNINEIHKAENIAQQNVVTKVTFEDEAERDTGGEGSTHTHALRTTSRKPGCNWGSQSLRQFFVDYTDDSSPSRRQPATPYTKKKKKKNR